MALNGNRNKSQQEVSGFKKILILDKKEIR